MSSLAVTAIGVDQPGIIARVTGVLYKHGGNLTDSSMTILGGHFAIMLLVDCGTAPDELETALTESTRDLGLIVRVAEVGEGHESAPASHVLTVYGTDRPGIVHAASRTLADAGVNVTDLTTRVLAGEQPVYACVMEVAVPAATDEEALAALVRDGVGGVEVSVQPIDAETL